MMLLPILLLLAAPQAADPLAPARAGKIQCVGVNKANKTCIATGSYKVNPDGSYESTVKVLINPTPAITMQTHAKGKVEDGKVCGIVRKEDYSAAVLEMNGAPLEPSMAEGIKTQLLAAVASMDGKNACSSERAEGDVLISEVTLDGVARPELTQKFIWIGADEGYTLGMP